MNQKVAFAFLFTICGLAAADKEVLEALKGQSSIHHLPVSNVWASPVSHEVHDVGSVSSIYVPTYQQETTYTYPQHYESYEVDQEVKLSPLVALLALLPIPKVLAVKLASGIIWAIGNIKSLLLGVGLTVAVCSCTTFCHISWQPDIHHHFRSLATPARIDAAANFVKKAIQKFSSLQDSSEVNPDTV